MTVLSISNTRIYLIAYQITDKNTLHIDGHNHCCDG